MAIASDCDPMNGISKFFLPVAAVPCLFALFFSEATAAHSSYIRSEGLPATLVGDAKFGDGTAAYTETHSFEIKEGRLHGLSTEYLSAAEPKGGKPTPIATMTHTFSAPGFLPDYSYSDRRNEIEHRLTVNRETKQLMMVRRSKEKEKTKEKIKTLPVTGSQVAGQGVYFWILANLDGILKKERAHVKFVVPGLLDEYSFHADLIKTENGRHTIRVELDNWFFRLFASKTQFDIDEKTRRLLEYRGPSNVADTKRRYRDVVIIYRAELPSEAPVAAR